MSQTAIRVKVCGLTSVPDALAAVEAGASFIGLVFFPKSPRNVSVEQAAEIATSLPVGVAKVALLVNPTDAQLEDILAKVPVDIIQLHGSESVERVAEIKARYGLPVMKAVGVAQAGDLEAIETYARVSDMILVDAKPAPDAALPGGNGHAFDWSLVAGRRWPVPWMLAGGLTPETAKRAVSVSGAHILDVSSGVESSPGRKDAGKIAALVAAMA